MTTAITILLTVIALALGLACILLYNIYLKLETSTKYLQDIKQFQMNPRTRMSTIEVQSGPVSEEQLARRVGRATASRRVVFGGEPEAELNQALERQFQEVDDDE